MIESNLNHKFTNIVRHCFSFIRIRKIIKLKCKFLYKNRRKPTNRQLFNNCLYWVSVKWLFSTYSPNLKKLWNHAVSSIHLLFFIVNGDAINDSILIFFTSINFWYFWLLCECLDAFKMFPVQCCFGFLRAINSMSTKICSGFIWSFKCVISYISVIFVYSPSTISVNKEFRLLCR